MKIYFHLITLSLFSGCFCQENHPTNQLVDGWIYNHTVPAVINADPRGSIRCIGARPDYLLELEPNRPSADALQSALEYCAEPEYGGKLQEIWRDRTLPGTACGYFFNPPRIVISKKWSSRRYGDDWKRFLYCQMKCTCVDVASISAATAQAIDSSNRVLMNLANQRRLSSSEHNIYAIIRQSDIPLLSLADKALVDIRHPIPIFQSLNGLARETSPRSLMTRKVIVSGINWNQIVCRQALPPWPLPIDRNYANLHELCAANFLGGNPDGNAGALCVDPDSNELIFPHTFSHPLLSSPSYEHMLAMYLSGDVSRQFTISAAISTWCLANCVCETPSRRTGKRASYSDVTPAGTVRLQGRSWVASASIPGQDAPATWFMIDDSGQPSNEAPYRGGHESSTCMSFSQQSPYCVNPPPEDRAAHLVDAFAKLWAFVPSRSINQIEQQQRKHYSCGSTCSGPQDCFDVMDNDLRAGMGSLVPQVNDRGCRCAVERDSVVTSQRYDPVLGIAVKLAFQASCVMLGTAVRQGSSMSSNERVGGKKERLRRKREEEDQWQAPLCACNGTYVSTECCWSADGLV